MLDQNQFTSYLAEIIYNSIDEIFRGPIIDHIERRKEECAKLDNIVTYAIYGFLSSKNLKVNLWDVKALVAGVNFFGHATNIKDHLNYVIDYSMNEFKQ